MKTSDFASVFACALVVSLGCDSSDGSADAGTDGGTSADTGGTDADDGPEDDGPEDDGPEDDGPEDDGPEDDTTGDDGPGGAAMLSFEFTGLEDLGPDYVYEGWVIVDDGPVSAGRFTVDEAGTASLTDVELTADDMAQATKYVLTIEPAEGDDPAPAPTHLLAGDFADNSAPLSIADGAALGTDLTTSAGSFILTTPTTADVDEDYAQGIWWLDPTGPAASLALPELPEGWIYEGWVVGENGPESTGRFLAGDAADSDGAGAQAGPDGAPPFPGQDIIEKGFSLVGYAAVISVEPEPDNAAGPFTLKPLVNGDIQDMAAPAVQDMTFQETAPTGMAWFVVE